MLPWGPLPLQTSDEGCILRLIPAAHTGFLYDADAASPHTGYTMHVILSSLHRPDDSTWHNEYGYSPVMAHVLGQSYARIKRPPITANAFYEAGIMVLPYLKARMSFRQRMQLYFILAVAHAADNEYADARNCTDRALAIALRLEETADQVELLTLRASLNRAMLRFDEAVVDLRDRLDILDRQRDITGLDDTAIRLETFAHLGTYAFYMAKADVAERAIAEARALAPLVRDGQFAAATNEWVQAHLYRTQGKVERALFHILAIQDDYMSGANPVSQDRLEFFIADTALDWAGRLPPGSDRQAFIALAHPHLNNAERLAKDNADLPGQGLARLGRVRYSRLSRTMHDRIASIEWVIKLAKSQHDEGLLAQALTTLGDELADMGDMESSINAYRATLAALEGTQVPVLALPAQRALRRAQGMDDLDLDA